MTVLLGYIFAGILATLCAVEVARHVPLLLSLYRMNKVGQRAFYVLRSKTISEHWKEKVLPSYSGRLLKASLQLLVSVLGISLVYVAIFFGISTLLQAEADWTLGVVHPLVLGMSVGTAVLFVRMRPFRKRDV